MEGDKIKNSIRYRILIKNKDCYFKVGTVVIRTYTGDMLYTQSDRVNTQDNKKIDHVSWHVNGRVHIKYCGVSEDKYDIIQKDEERQKISEIGFQDLVTDTVKDYKKLPKYTKVVIDLDVVFEIGDYPGSVVFCFSMVSGKLIVAQYHRESVPSEGFKLKKDWDVIGVISRALGWHSGSPDVILQYSLKKTDAENLKTNRKIFIPHDMKISKIKKC